MEGFQVEQEKRGRKPCLNEDHVIKDRISKYYGTLIMSTIPGVVVNQMGRRERKIDRSCMEEENGKDESIKYKY